MQQSECSGPPPSLRTHQVCLEVLILPAEIASYRPWAPHKIKQLQPTTRRNRTIQSIHFSLFPILVL